MSDLSIVEVTLKPCPNPWCASHCREETREAYAPYVKLFSSGYRVVCAVCPQIGPSDAGPDKAITAWNTRASTASEAERVREACANTGYWACAETRHVTLGEKVRAAIRSLPIGGE